MCIPADESERTKRNKISTTEELDMVNNGLGLLKRLERLISDARWTHEQLSTHDSSSYNAQTLKGLEEGFKRCQKKLKFKEDLKKNISLSHKWRECHERSHSGLHTIVYEFYNSNDELDYAMYDDEGFTTNE